MKIKSARDQLVQISLEQVEIDIPDDVSHRTESFIEGTSRYSIYSSMDSRISSPSKMKNKRIDEEEKMEKSVSQVSFGDNSVMDNR